MRAHRTARAARGKWLWLLAAGSACLLLLAPRWVAPLISLVQVLVPFEDAADRAVGAVAGTLRPPDQPVSAEQYGALEARNRALQNQVVALSAAIARLDAENRVLTALRGSGLGAEGRLIPARVITRDLAPWRSSRLLDAGTLRGVRRGAPVTSRVLEFDGDGADGVRDGMAVLRAESLVGVVEQAGTHNARVRLLTDVDTQMKVRIGAFTDDAFELLPTEHWLVGRGHGLMEIRDIAWSVVEAGTVRAGDVVVSDPHATWLPTSLTIGRIASIERDRDNPLLAIAAVRAPVDEYALSGVYVYDPTAQSEP